MPILFAVLLDPNEYIIPCSYFTVSNLLKIAGGISLAIRMQAKIFRYCNSCNITRSLLRNRCVIFIAVYTYMRCVQLKFLIVEYCTFCFVTSRCSAALNLFLSKHRPIRDQIAFQFVGTIYSLQRDSLCTIWKFDTTKEEVKVRNFLVHDVRSVVIRYNCNPVAHAQTSQSALIFPFRNEGGITEIALGILKSPFQR